MAFPSLVLGSFNLTDWAGVAYNTSVIAEGTSRGAPVPIEVAVKSWLQDGSVVVTQGYDNRTGTWPRRWRSRGAPTTCAWCARRSRARRRRSPRRHRLRQA
jgi:hypothetical protein